MTTSPTPDAALDEALARVPRYAPPAHLVRALAASAPSSIDKRAARRRWAVSMTSSLALAAAACAIFVRVHSAGDARARLIDDVVDDHVRILAREHPFDIESGGIHQVKPWFQGKLDFAPTLAYAGDDFPLQGGSLAVVRERRCAAFHFAHRLHKITLLVCPLDANDVDAWPSGRVDVRGYHALSWRTASLAYALVSDVDAADLAELERRIELK